MRVLAVSSLCVLLVGCGGEPPPPVEVPRTVTVTTLREFTPEPPFELTGVAEPYREADVGFEVSGRITKILDVGRTAEVRTREKTDEEIAQEKAAAAPDHEVDPLVHQGDVIAWLDTTTYQQRLDAATLRLETAKAGLEAMRIDSGQVGPATVARAEAQRDAALSEVEASRAVISSFQSSRDKAGRDLERNTALLRDKQISRAEYDQLQTAFDAALANLAQAKARLKTSQDQAEGYEAALTEARASLRLKKANVGRAEAELAELQVAVDQAQTQLDRCVLRTPFSGRITRVSASIGDFVNAGQPVLTLTLIDPIKVSVTVSADREREVKPGNYARVMPRRLGDYKADDTEYGVVFEKGAVADPTTRTFRIDIMVRNARRMWLAQDEDAARVRFQELLPAVERYSGGGGPLFVAQSCVVDQPDGRKLVYRIKGAKFGAPREAELFEDKIELERLEIECMGRTPKDFMQILNWSFRRVRPAGEGPALELGDLLISFERLDPRAVEKGIVLVRYDWAIRPGDLVPVAFPSKSATRGIWVPDAAVRAENDKRSLFLVEDGKAREVGIRVIEGFGGLHRVEGDGLAAGQELVLKGVHYLYDGAPVVVVEEKDVDLEETSRTQR